MTAFVAAIIAGLGLALTALYLALWFFSRRLRPHLRLAIFALPPLGYIAWVSLPTLLYPADHLYEQVFQAGAEPGITDLQAHQLDYAEGQDIFLSFRATPEAAQHLILLNYFGEIDDPVEAASGPSVACPAAPRIYSVDGIFGWSSLRLAHCQQDGSVHVYAHLDKEAGRGP